MFVVENLEDLQNDQSFVQAFQVVCRVKGT